MTSRRPRAPHPVPISQRHRLMSFTANGIKVCYSQYKSHVKELFPDATCAHLARISGLFVVASRSRHPRFLKIGFVLIMPLAACAESTRKRQPQTCGLNFQKPTYLSVCPLYPKSGLSEPNVETGQQLPQALQQSRRNSTTTSWSVWTPCGGVFWR